MKQKFTDILGSRPLRDITFLTLGAVIQAVALNVFLIPSQVASGGVSGLAQILNHLYGLPVGVLYMLGNIPLIVLGWRYLGGMKFAVRTVITAVIYALAVDLSAPYLPASGIADDTLLNALYGGVIAGIGYGLVYRGRGTSGGTDILARIIAHYRGIPISQIYMMTDALVMLIAGLVFGWENALYAILALYLSGLTAETVSQGQRVVRTATIITDKPVEVAAGIMSQLGRGVTRLDGTGLYTGAARPMLYVVLSRAEVEPIKSIVRNADEKAFLVIGHAYEAMGEGFASIHE